MKPVYEYKSIPFELKDLDTKEGILFQYYSSFNTWDAIKDMVAPGAFTKTLQEQGPTSSQPRIKHFLNHDINQPLGKLFDARQDDYGLLAGSKIGTHNGGQDFIKMVESGLITEGSMGYITVKSQEVSQGRILKELTVMELSSLSGWGCNQWTPIVGLKSDEEIDRISTRLKSLEKFCRNSTATDETIEMLLLEVKQLTQLTIDLKADTTKPTANVTQPENEKTINWQTIANQLITNQFSQK